jgi:hypothetical protein
LADPWSVAVVLVMLVAGFVTTTGTAGTVNERTSPYALPDAFSTIAQK